MEKNELGHALRAARKAKGLSMAELAEQLGFSTAAIQQWETGKTKPKPNNLVEAARALDADPRRLLAIQAKLHGATETPETPSTVETPETGYRATPNATPDPAPALLPTISSAPRDIEELGITVGGFADDDSAFEMNGQVVDMVPRPPGIAHRKGVFALRVGNESMIPKFEDGERIYAEKQKPAVRDYVVVELYPREEGRPGKSFVKRLVSMDSNRVVVEQFNPRGRLEFDRREIKDIFRVIPWVELLAF
ncbi:XRE family transcriptional regulator [Bosea sp. 2KB_26]|uniref:XRE family transcriptional regulator n=1 Tax=Bosea sp. 2KB_26 TaxID=3237475 RepID=UPI003F908980